MVPETARWAQSPDWKVRCSKAGAMAELTSSQGATFSREPRDRRPRRLALAGLVHSSANVLLLDEPTNNLDPASRDEVLGAVGSYPGAIVMVTHDEGAIEALRPDRVLILPDASEDLWSDDYLDLVSLA